MSDETEFQDEDEEEEKSRKKSEELKNPKENTDESDSEYVNLCWNLNVRKEDSRKFMFFLEGMISGCVNEESMYNMKFTIASYSSWPNDNLTRMGSRHSRIAVLQDFINVLN